jgi:hypothetical protein
MPAVKLYPISSGPQPVSMSIPNIAVGSAKEPQEGAAPGEAEAAPADDGFSPEERRKIELEEDPNFKKILMMLRMKVPLFQIRQKIKGEGVYNISDADLFADQHEIDAANNMLV